MAGIVFGCIVPHPPLIVPDVGRGREVEISNTIESMNQLTERLARSRPETVFIVSPHGAYFYDAMGVLKAASSSGNMHRWGARGPDLHFENDLEIVAALEAEARAASVPLRPLGEGGYELDHGVMVPLHFLAQAMVGVPLVPLTFCWLPLEAHFAFGQAIRRAAEGVGRRVAIIASGDLSHRLIPDAPAGYHPAGKAFDDMLVQAIASYDVPSIMNMDESLIDHAGECGLRSIVILLGALDGLRVTPDVLSYEGPFGVGYMVASLQVEDDQSLHPLVRLARDTVESYVGRGETPSPPAELTPEMSEQAGVFVSLKIGGMLRGCIGTFEPIKDNVAEEVIVNAVSAATRDPRFPPVTARELDLLDYSVDVLTAPEPVDDIADLDPRRHGLIVESGHRRGLLLPDLEGIDTVEQQLEICRAKAGLSPDEPVVLYRFEVKRYR
ncbi:MAG: AmmeMemoRadiSam system protein A [Chloroflexota bacterium]|nr:AmmeMemoRadiSam system protein A [Chloroflexota bacterium]